MTDEEVWANNAPPEKPKSKKELAKKVAINPEHEETPVSGDKKRNLDQLDKEMKLNKDPAAQKILKQEKAKVAGDGLKDEDVWGKKKGMSVPQAIVQEGKNIIHGIVSGVTAPMRALESGSGGDYMEGGGGPGEEEAVNTAGLGLHVRGFIKPAAKVGEAAPKVSAGLSDEAVWSNTTADQMEAVRPTPKVKPRLKPKSTPDQIQRVEPEEIPKSPGAIQVAEEPPVPVETATEAPKGAPAVVPESAPGPDLAGRTEPSMGAPVPEAAEAAATKEFAQPVGVGERVGDRVQRQMNEQKTGGVAVEPNQVVQYEPGMEETPGKTDPTMKPAEVSDVQGPGATEHKIGLPKDRPANSLELAQYDGEFFESGPLPEPKRIQTHRRLKTLVDKFWTGKINKGKFVSDVTNIVDQLDSNKIFRAAEGKPERARGPDWLKERIMRAKRTGELTPEGSDFALWLLDKNPNLADDLGISIREQKNMSIPGSYGVYEPIERIIELSKAPHTDAGTAVHEIMHHSERMMPEDVQQGIRRQWAARLGEEWSKAPPRSARAEAIAAIGHLVAEPNKATYKKVIEFYNEGVLKPEDYQLINPSEYWAVNSTRILAGRQQAGWVARARQWVKELTQHLKGALGMGSDAPVLKGLSTVLKSEAGDFNPRQPLVFDQQGGDVNFRNLIPKTAEEKLDRDTFPSRSDIGEMHAGVPLGSLPEAVKQIVSDFRSSGLFKAAAGIAEDLQMKASPMAIGSNRAKALAKDWANADRKARYQWSNIDRLLQKSYTPEQRKVMWEAMSEESEMAITGNKVEGKGLDRLPAEQRDVLKQLDKYDADLWEQAQGVGLVKGNRIPYYAARIGLNVDDKGNVSWPREAEGFPLDPKGRNITATGPKKRQYLSVQETEEALKARFGDQATLFKDSRVLPYAYSRLERAIAGRRLVNGIKDVGKNIGEDLVSEGEKPGFFTLDHPAFKTWRPRFIEKDGKVVPVTDEAGNIVFDRVPIYISKEFEGPMRAIMNQQMGNTEKALMALKGKAMSVIMYSPMIHNMVEWGRALPAMPGKVFSFRVYFDGNKFKNNPTNMNQAISDGLVPISNRWNMQDITGMAEEPTIKAGRSLTAKAVGGAVGMVSKEAGEAVKRGVDKAGDFYHNTLLWDRVADLQAGLYVNFKKSMIEKGLDEQSAGRVAAHLANRYAGALPAEAMSRLSRNLANFTLFSRTFTIGNLGVIKDMIKGLPSEVQAQILRDSGEIARSAAVSAAQRKSIQAYLMDIALFYAGNSALQDGLDALKRDQTLDETAKGYVDRASNLAHRSQDHPLEVLTSPFQDLQALSSTSKNEPGKEARLLYGYEDTGTGIYIRLPTGKIGEEFIGWTTSPLDMIKRKESTVARPLIQTFTNDVGFGKRLYNAEDNTTLGMAKSVGRIVGNFFEAQVPIQALEGMKDYISDPSSPKADVNLAKALLPAVGLTVSRGFPGGPESGALYAAKRAYMARKQEAMPTIRKLLEKGETNEALDKMEEIGMPIDERKQILKSMLRQGPSRYMLKEYEQYHTPEEQEKREQVR